MTVKEITNKIKHILEELSYPSAVAYLTLNDKKWLKATIKALEQEPCGKDINVPATDAISRTEVIKSIDEREDVNGKVDAESIRTDIVLMPPVKTQEPKTGHWKKWEYGTHRCSICDKFIGRERYPYCPYCGAKMVEPQERSGE